MSVETMVTWWPPQATFAASVAARSSASLPGECQLATPSSAKASRSCGISCCRFSGIGERPAL
ncbi:hypothetical protein AK51_17645 [Serratia nematodiphila DZ0503SBS1]|nr:hypothetical protein AK51_17645 [Serratia nematodiphila DZ0503SBS1]